MGKEKDFMAFEEWRRRVGVNFNYCLVQISTRTKMRIHGKLPNTFEDSKQKWDKKTEREY